MKPSSINLLFIIDCSVNFHWLNGQNQGDSRQFFIQRVSASIDKEKYSFVRIASFSCGLGKGKNKTKFYYGNESDFDVVRIGQGFYQ